MPKTPWVAVKAPIEEYPIYIKVRTRSEKVGQASGLSIPVLISGHRPISFRSKTRDAVRPEAILLRDGLFVIPLFTWAVHLLSTR